MAKDRKRTATAPVPDIDPSSEPSTRSVHDGVDDRDPRERIAMRAYELYLSRGASDGRDFDDWLAAEREVRGADSPAQGDSGE